MSDIYIDADACPVKDEVYRVARRYRLQVFLVSNRSMRFPRDVAVTLVQVDDHLDAADDWIADHVQGGDIAITADIPLASRCLQAGARVLGFKGRPFTADSIGGALAMRGLTEMLRGAGEFTGGPAPMTRRDRSRFLSRLDEMVHAARREQSA